MRVLVFSTKPYDRKFLDAENVHHGHNLRYIEARLTSETAILAADAVCVFVNDLLAIVRRQLADRGVRLVGR